MANDVINYRYSISGLSKSNYLRAENEEILVDKSTGEMLIKRPDGKVISYDANARLKLALQNMELVSTKHLLRGKIYHVELENRMLPELLTSRDVLTNDVILLKDAISLDIFNKIIIQLDLDLVSKESDVCKMTFEDIDVKITVSNTKSILSRRSSPAIIPIKYSQLNETILKLDKFNPVEGQPMYINAISIGELPETVDVILNSIIIMAI